jgi:hypothetical protein
MMDTTTKNTAHRLGKKYSLKSLQAEGIGQDVENKFKNHTCGGQLNENCASIVASNGLKAAGLEAFNKQTW